MLLPGRTVIDLPDWLSPGAATHYPVDDFTLDGAEDLIRVLTEQPSYVKRPLGLQPALPPHPRPPRARA